MKLWTKYLLEFVVIVFSILAAFWLEEWGQEREKEERMKAILLSLQSELANNFQAIEWNYKQLRDFNEVTRFLEKKPRENGYLKLSQSQLDSLGHNVRFARDLKLVKQLNSGEGLYEANVLIDFLPAEIVTSNWDACISSGVLSDINHEHLAELTLVYHWIKMDFSFSNADFYNIFIESETEYDDAAAIERSYRRLEKVYELKHTFLQKHYSKVEQLMSERLER